MDTLLRQLDEMKEYLARFEHMLLLGIGGFGIGSARPAKGVFSPAGPPRPQGALVVDRRQCGPDHLAGVISTPCPRKRPVVVVISKSGGTIETASQYILAKEWLREKLGNGWKDNILAVTDAGKGQLRQGSRRVGHEEPARAGQSGGPLLRAFRRGACACGLSEPRLPAHRPGRAPTRPRSCAPPSLRKKASTTIRPGSWPCGTGAHGKGLLRTHLFRVHPVVGHFRQLVRPALGESLGKEGKGSMPLPSVGVTDQHSVNQMYLDGPRNKACPVPDLLQPGTGRAVPGRPAGQLRLSEGPEVRRTASGRGSGNPHGPDQDRCSPGGPGRAESRIVRRGQIDYAA